jgi:hypothetical protein
VHSPAVPIQLNLSAIDVIVDLVEQLTASPNSFDVFDVILDDFINTGVDLEDIFGRLKRLFADWLGNITFEDLKELIIPKLSATIHNISLGLSIPASILRQVDINIGC